MSILWAELAGLCPHCATDDNVCWYDSAPNVDTWGCTQCGSTWVINLAESGGATVAAMAEDNDGQSTIDIVTTETMHRRHDRGR